MVAVPLVVWLALKLPQGDGAVHVTDQSTPPLPASFETVAFTLSWPPAVTDEGAAGVNTMLSVVTTIENPGTVVCWPTPSVSVTLKLTVVAVGGVPVTWPVLALMERLSVRAGVVLHVSGANPEPWKVKL